MKLELIRYEFGPTFGILHVDGEVECDTLEDQVREVKVPHETCIPEGSYDVILDFSNRFQKIMPHVLNVPNFEGIRIHSGNTVEDTSGCILVGERSGNTLINSRLAWNKLMEKLKTADKITLTISSAKK